MENPLYTLGASELNRLFLSGQVSAAEITRAVLDRLTAVDGRLNAFITVAEDQAMTKARELDRRRAAGEDLGPLAGVPIALKDNISVDGLRMTCASKILADYVAPYDATVVTRLKNADAIIIGKTNMDEFAMGASGETSYFGPTHNPWDLDRIPGGSSSGSAAAVAGRVVPLALGTDTGGSIRQPAALTGIVGLKPTYGAVSRYGVVAFASSLDQVGPLGRDAVDVATLLSVIAGPDPMDATNAGWTFPMPDFTGEPSLKGVRIGLPSEFFGEGLQPEVKACIDEAVRTLEDLGARVDACSLPHSEYALSVYYIVAPAEASANLARFDGVRYGYRAAQAGTVAEMYVKSRSEGFGTEVKRRIVIGAHVLSSGNRDTFYKKAQQVRTLIGRDFDRAFEEFDVLLAPTSPKAAWRLGEKLDDPISMYLADTCTIPPNLVGLPALSLPCGHVDGLPVGMQFIGKHFDEARLLKLAWAYQRVTQHHLAEPALAVEGGR